MSQFGKESNILVTPTAIFCNLEQYVRGASFVVKTGVLLGYCQSNVGVGRTLACVIDIERRARFVSIVLHKKDLLPP